MRTQDISMHNESYEMLSNANPQITGDSRIAFAKNISPVEQDKMAASVVEQ